VDAAVLDPELGQAQIPTFVAAGEERVLEPGSVAEQEVELDERLLRERVRGDDVAARRRSHQVAHVVGEAHRDAQELVPGRGQVVVDAGFDEAAGVVDVVLPAQQPAVEPPALLRAGELRVGVEVPGGVGRGRGGDPPDVAVQAGFQRAVAPGGEEVGGAADGLVDQAVVPRLSGVSAGQPVPDAVEVGERALGLELVEAVRDRHLVPGPPARRPEPVVDRDGRDGDGRQGMGVRGGGDRGGGGAAMFGRHVASFRARAALRWPCP
jgi:hypothetical protein